jgi:hypothetical protein
MLVASIGCLVQGQVASDYYNRPQQEMFASVAQESTYVHKAGFLPCFSSVYNWANKNRAKYNFLSVTANDSLGIVRVTSAFDCRNLFGDSTRHDSSVCNLIITSFSGNLKIGFADIKSKQSCGALRRISIQKEIVHIVSLLPDSVATVVKAPRVSKGIGDTGYLSSFDIALAKVKADSIKSADSTRVVDSVAKIVIISSNTPSVSPVDAQRVVDSIALIFNRDSVAERQQALLIFKKQLDLNKPVSVDTKLECLDFLIGHNFRTVAQVQDYLIYLSKLCQDRVDLFYAARLIVIPEQKYLCVRYFKKAQNEYSKVQFSRAKVQ